MNEITKHLIMKRKHDSRIQKLKTIDEQNMKIFQTLSAVKSNISKLKLPKYQIIKQPVIVEEEDTA